MVLFPRFTMFNIYWNKQIWVDKHFLLSTCIHEFTSHFRNFEDNDVKMVGF